MELDLVSKPGLAEACQGQLEGSEVPRGDWDRRGHLQGFSRARENNKLSEPFTYLAVVVKPYWLVGVDETFVGWV